jgi:peptidoglycan/LPS O-acetylase OafA/YrhL
VADEKVNETTHLDSLDGIRALAIGAVFLLHIGRAHFPGGSFGVDVFFVLSAYLITGILLREVHHRGRIDFGGFYWRRFFRLAPALVLWLALIAAPTALLAHQAGKIPWSTAGALFYFNDFLQAWTHLVGTAYDQSWSLAVEEQFYFVWPFVLFLVVTRLSFSAQRQVMLGIIIVSTVLWYLIGNYFLPTGHLVPLALGAWAAFWSSQSEGRRWLAPIVADTRAALVCGAVFALALFIAPTSTRGYLLGFAVDVAAMVLVLHCVVNVGSIASRSLRSPVPRWIGVRSYGIYLYGLTLMQLIPLATHLRLHYAAPLDVLATAIVVWLSYRFIEAPFRTRGRRWLATRRDPGQSIESAIELPPLDS